MIAVIGTKVVLALSTRTDVVIGPGNDIRIYTRKEPAIGQKVGMEMIVEEDWSIG